MRHCRCVARPQLFELRGAWVLSKKNFYRHQDFPSTWSIKIHVSNSPSKLANTEALNGGNGVASAPTPLNNVLKSKCAVTTHLMVRRDLDPSRICDPADQENRSLPAVCIVGFYYINQLVKKGGSENQSQKNIPVATGGKYFKNIPFDF